MQLSDSDLERHCLSHSLVILVSCCCDIDLYFVGALLQALLNSDLAGLAYGDLLIAGCLRVR